MNAESSGVPAEQARLEFGKYLVTQRERRGLSRSDVVKATKLPSMLVGAIEDGESEKWPERVFVLNALRTYASAVGLPVDETLSRFDALAEAPKPLEFDPQALEVARREHAIAGVLATVALMLAGALWFFLQAAWVFVQRASWSLR